MATNAFELYAKISADTKDFETKLKDAEKKGKTFLNKLGDAGKKIGAGAAKVTKGLTAGIVAASAAVGVAAGKIIKSAVTAYGRYEQLAGGVKKLFGPTSAELIEAFASRAYKTAGMSANDYMEMVTSFSASLISSLGGDTVKAAYVADKAIQDMSDNANTFGTDMASIQAAYQGFAKQNYTMLKGYLAA